MVPRFFKNLWIPGTQFPETDTSLAHCSAFSHVNPKILPCWEQHMKYVRSKTYSNSTVDGGYIIGLKTVIWMPTIPQVSHFFCFHNDWFQYWKMYLDFMGFLPYEACLIIPLQTLLIDCKCLLKTQTQVLQRWDKNLCIIKCSEHQLWLLKYTISEMNTQYNHSEIITHDITLKTITCMYWTKKKSRLDIALQL